MNVVLDLIVAVILVWSVITAVHRGFIRSLLGMFTVIGAFIFTVLFSGQVSAYLEQHFVAPALRSSAISYLSRLTGTTSTKSASSLPMEKFLTDMPKVFTDYIHRLGSSEASVKAASSSAADLTSARDAAVNAIITPMANAVSSVLGFLLVFIVTLLVLSALVALLDMLFRLPVLSTLNRLGGFAMGCVTGVLLVFILCSAVSAMQPVLDSSSVLGISDETIGKTLLFGIFYKANLLPALF